MELSQAEMHAREEVYGRKRICVMLPIPKKTPVVDDGNGNQWTAPVVDPVTAGTIIGVGILVIAVIVLVGSGGTAAPAAAAIGLVGAAVLIGPGLGGRGGGGA